MLKVEFLFETCLKLRLIIIMKINKNNIESLMSTANNYIKIEFLFETEIITILK